MLTSIEEKIFSILNKTCEKFSPKTELRVAGGWVRDKLLKQESLDIDIAVSNMSGLAFAKLVVKQTGGKISVIEANPDQSKHLETAQLYISGQLIEFANLRKETYADSRIPDITPGTPKEDAYRRDLTINSMFYNLKTSEFEDFTGCGMKDLKDRIARTPLEARQTFLDDPLRILRTLRFATRYNLKLDDSIKIAASSFEVQEAFKTKVSKERVWKELVGQSEPGGWKRGILTAKNGRGIYEAVVNLYEFGYFPILFNVKRKLCPWDMDQRSQYHDLTVIGHTLKALEHLTTRIELPEDPEDCAVRHLVIILHDIGKLDRGKQQEKEDGSYSYKGHWEASYDMVYEILEGLKAPLVIQERVANLVSEHMRYHWMDTEPKDKPLRKVMVDLGVDWEHLIDISTSDLYGKDSVWDIEGLGYSKLRERSLKLLSEQGGKTKVIRPINGYDLKELGVLQGPMMGKIFSELDEYLLESPNMSRIEAIEFVTTFIESKT